MPELQAKLPVSLEHESAIVPKRKANQHLAASGEHPATSLARFQQTMGNQAVQRMLGALMIQAKLTVNQPGDQYEQEADRVADRVMRMLDSPAGVPESGGAQIQRMCAGCQEEQKQLHAKPVSDYVSRSGEGEGDAAPEVESAIEGARGGGHALEGGVQRRMESAFGADFSGVRIHTDARADALNRAVNAVAFTTGSDIFFRQGTYNPESSSGKHLLAHELTHVVQQGGMRQAHGMRTQRSLQRNGQGTSTAVGAVAGGLVGAGIGALVGGPLGAAVGGLIGLGVGALVGWLVGAPRANVPTHIRAASTPASMAADRIPPRVNTPAAITVSGIDPSAPPVTLSVEGQSASNGTVTINGGATANLRANATVQLQGATQTTPGNAGNLQLVAKQGPTELARSAGFSVSAIPQNWSVAFQSLITEATDPGLRGMRVTNSWQSDSGNLADLDQAKRAESVEPTQASGCFNMGPSNTSGDRDATLGSIIDQHATPAAIMTSAGRRVAQQTFKFRDDRTGSVNIPARNAGFLITRVVTASGAGFQLQTTKAGHTGTANGIQSDAGGGNADSGQQPV